MMKRIFAYITMAFLVFPMYAVDQRSAIQRDIETAQEQLARVSQELAMHICNAQGTLANVDAGLFSMEEIQDEFSVLTQLIQSLQQQKQELEEYIAQLENQLKEPMEVG